MKMMKKSMHKKQLVAKRACKAVHSDPFGLNKNLFNYKTMMQRKFHENILTIYPPLARRVIDKVPCICLMDAG